MKHRIFLTVLFLLIIPQSVFADDAATAAEEKRWNDLAAFSKEERAAAKHPDGMTALHWAVFHQNEKAVEMLLKAGADPNAATEYDVTPLYTASGRQNADIVKLLLDHDARVNDTLPGGESSLMTAGRSGHEDSISALLKAGADINDKEKRGQTALMWAAASGNVAAVERLIEAGADINAETWIGFTAMMFAARNGRPEVVELLAKAGVDVNAVMNPKSSGGRNPRKGTSALTLSVESGHFELAMLLIRLGADPNDQRSGFTPLHALSWIRKPNRGEDPNGDPSPRGSGSLTSLDFVRAIVGAGADVNARLKRGQKGKAKLTHAGATPFLLAGKTADLPYLKLLLELNADPNLTNADGTTAQMAAAGIGVRAVGEEAGTEDEVIECIQWLHELGQDVNTVDNNKETAMHGAAYRNFPRVVDCLAELGADPESWNHKNASGWTPIMIGQGHRPGSFKPSPPTVDALQRAIKSFERREKDTGDRRSEDD